MPRYQVKHTFPAAEVVTIGQIFTDPPWQHLQLLVNQGYLAVLDDEPKKPAAEKSVTEPAKPAAKKKSQ
jgi:hypothetical protein